MLSSVFAIHLPRNGFYLFGHQPILSYGKPVSDKQVFLQGTAPQVGGSICKLTSAKAFLPPNRSNLAITAIFPFSSRKIPYIGTPPSRIRTSEGVGNAG
jgi:hypothetical protein